MCVCVCVRMNVERGRVCVCVCTRMGGGCTCSCVCVYEWVSTLLKQSLVDFSCVFVLSCRWFVAVQVENGSSLDPHFFCSGVL